MIPFEKYIGRYVRVKWKLPNIRWTKTAEGRLVYNERDNVFHLHTKKGYLIINPGSIIKVTSRKPPGGLPKLTLKMGSNEEPEE